MAASRPTVGSSGGSSRGRDDSSPGGVIGSLLQGGGSTGGSLFESSPYIVADNRLNSLFVQGTPAQVQMIDEILKIVDQESGPEEVLTFPKPKFIPVYYTSAEHRGRGAPPGLLQSHRRQTRTIPAGAGGDRKSSSAVCVGGGGDRG